MERLKIGHDLFLLYFLVSLLIVVPFSTLSQNDLSSGPNVASFCDLLRAFIPLLSSCVVFDTGNVIFNM
jgi:hypothetical protein